LLNSIRLKVEDIDNASQENTKEFKEVDKGEVGY